MEDWLKTWYKEGFEKSKVHSPKKNWKKIASELEEWPSHWYKKNVAEIKIKPKHTIWGNIEQQLQQQQPKRVFAFSLNYFILVSGIVLMPFLLVHPPYFYDSTRTAEFSFAQVDNPVSIKTKEYNPTSLINAKDEDLVREIENQKKISSHEPPSIENILPAEHINKKEEQHKYISTHIETLKNSSIDDSEEGIDFTQPTFIPMYALNNSLYFENSLRQNKVKIDQKGWYIGGGATIQKTSLLNPITQRSLSKTSSLNTKVSMNIGAHLNAYNQFNNRSALSATIFLNNKKIQQYELFENQELTTGKMELNYLLLGVNYHRRLKHFSNKSMGISSIVGLFTGINTGISEVVNTKDVVIFQNGFRKFDAGITAGYELNYSLSPKLMFYSDIVYQIGLINIFRGTDKIPSDFFHTQTSSLYLNLGLRFKM
jgi:hypothetical protein